MEGFQYETQVYWGSPHLLYYLLDQLSWSNISWQRQCVFNIRTSQRNVENISMILSSINGWRGKPSQSSQFFLCCWFCSLFFLIIQSLGLALVVVSHIWFSFRVLLGSGSRGDVSSGEVWSFRLIDNASWG